MHHCSEIYSIVAGREDGIEPGITYEVVVSSVAETEIPNRENRRVFAPSQPIRMQIPGTPHA